MSEFESKPQNTQDAKFHYLVFRKVKKMMEALLCRTQYEFSLNTSTFSYLEQHEKFLASGSFRLETDNDFARDKLERRALSSS